MKYRSFYIILLVSILVLAKPASMAGSDGYAFSSSIKLGEEFTWKVEELILPQDIEDPTQIHEGTEITITPLVELNSITFEGPYIGVEIWLEHFDYKVDSVKQDSIEDLVMYSSLIMPTTMTTDGETRNTFEVEKEEGSVFNFPGEVSVESNLFTWNFAYSDQNVSSKLINSWDIETGILVKHEFSYSSTVNGTVYQASEKLVYQGDVGSEDTLNSLSLFLVSVAIMSIVAITSKRRLK